ncbi:MAG: hypothetical protein JEZ00_05325 [Anaerolineaceae bacterium]|nr:hypothetical protein [Anaerolineaceae bacterium]
MTEKQRVVFHIDELILHGFAASDRDAIGDALIQELGELAANRNFKVNGVPRNLDSLRAPQIMASSQVKPSVVGTQVARSVYNSVTGTSDDGKER